MKRNSGGIVTSTSATYFSGVLDDCASKPLNAGVAGSEQRNARYGIVVAKQLADDAGLDAGDGVGNTVGASAHLVDNGKFWLSAPTG